MALSTNLVSYWKLDESSGNATDSVGGNTLTNNGSVPFVTGKLGNCADLESSGANQYFQSSSFAGGTSWSFSVWFNPETNTDQILISQDDVGTNRIFSLYFGAANAVLNGWTSGGTQKSTTATAHGMSTGTWYHWAGTWDASGNLTLYKNGAFFASVATTGNAKTTSQPLTVGRAADGSYYTDGKVDEIGYWDRALTASEVSQIFNSGMGNAYPLTDTPNLYGAVAYYKLDSNSNSSIRSNNGTDTSISYSNAGIRGNCATLNGTTSKIVLGVGTMSAALNNASAVTLSVWANITTLDSSDQTLASIKIKSSAGDEYRGASIKINGTSNTVVAGGRSVYTDTLQTKTGSAISTGSWVHLLAIFDIANDKIYLYRNGALDGSAASVTFANTVWTDSASHVTGDGIGAATVTGTFSEFVEGKIDELGVWNRALNSIEIAQLYLAGLGNTYPFGVGYTLTASKADFTLTGVATALKRGLKVVADYASYALTGVEAAFKIGKGIIAAVGNFVLTGFDAITKERWTKRTKSSSTFTNTDKSSSSWTNKSK